MQQNRGAGPQGKEFGFPQQREGKEDEQDCCVGPRVAGQAEPLLKVAEGSQ